MFWLRQSFAIARNAASVMLSDPVQLVMMMVWVLVTALLAYLPYYTFDEELQLVREQLLAIAFSGGCLASALGVTRVLVQERSQGAAPMIMSRPVPGSAYVWGKWLGVMTAAGLLMLVATTTGLWATRLLAREWEVEALGMAVLLGVTGLTLATVGLRVFFFRGVFVRQANLSLTAALCLAFFVLNAWGYNGSAQESYGSLVRWETAHAYVCLFLALGIYTAWMVGAGALVDRAVLMGVAAVVFFAGLVLPYLLSLLPSAPWTLLLQSIAPDWQVFWAPPSLHGAVAAPLQGLLLHAAGQSALLLLVASWLVKRRELA